MIVPIDRNGIMEPRNVWGITTGRCWGCLHALKSKPRDDLECRKIRPNRGVSIPPLRCALLLNPTQCKILNLFLNRLKDGRYIKDIFTVVDSKLRDVLERIEIRPHRGLRHYWGLHVHGQHTKNVG
uniref:Small ribosomal subunit protein uS13 n=1 Tax=Bursaphelenchus xylophilus TaxID=6326 RepID=A0A1I7SG94_BURXY